MITIANPEKWTNLRMVDVGSQAPSYAGNYPGLPGHLIALVQVESPPRSEYDHVAQRSVEKVTTKTIALVADTIDERIVSLTNERDWAKHEVENAVEKVQSADKLLDESDKKRLALERELVTVKATDAINREQADRATARLRKLEGDLAKVREHVGSKAFDEAINATKGG